MGNLNLRWNELDVFNLLRPSLGAWSRLRSSGLVLPLVKRTFSNSVPGEFSRGNLLLCVWFLWNLVAGISNLVDQVWVNIARDPHADLTGNFIVNWNHLDTTNARKNVDANNW